MTDTTTSDQNTTVYLENDGNQVSDLTVSTQDAVDATLVSDVCVIATNDATQGLDSSVIVQKPDAGESYDVLIEPGKKYFLDFAEEDVQSVLRSGDDLTIVLMDGSSVVLENAAGLNDGDLPATVAFKEEFSIQRFSEFFEVVDTTTSQDIEPESELRQAEADLTSEETVLNTSDEGSNDGGLAARLASTAPAAGSNTITASNDIAQNLANIEPAAGDTGGISSGSGYGFQSSFVARGVDGLEDVGPIDPTQLQYGIPQSEFEQLLTDQNDTPDILASNLHDLDETGQDLSTSGTVQVDFGADGAGEICANGLFDVSGSLDNPGILTSGGDVVTVTSTPTGYVGTVNGQTVFTLEINTQTGEYTYNQVLPFDHADGTNPDDVINLSFGIKATDADGDEVTTSILINVADDAPVIGDAVHSLDESDLGPLTVTDTISHDFYFDGAGAITSNGTFTATGSVLGGVLTSGGEVITVTQTADGYVGTTPGGTEIFTLTIDPATGEYVFTLNGVLDHADPNDPNDVIALNFGITIADADGDTDTGTITINVADSAPYIPDTTPDIGAGLEIVDETDLGPVEVSGQLDVDFGPSGDGEVCANGNFVASGSVLGGVLTSGGDLVDVVSTDTGYVGTANGQTIFTLTLQDDGSYTFNLIGVLDHADGTNPDDVITLTFGVDAKDGDGDTASGQIVVQVKDDGPAINNRWGAFDEADLDNGPIVITRDINHNYGADGEGSIEATGTFQALFEMGGTPQPVTSGGELITVTSTANSYTGTLPDGTVVFTLTIDPSTGQHTYTQYAPIDHVEGANPADEVIWLKFQVQITDKDGDTDTAWIVFDVHDDEPVAVDDVDSLDANGVATGTVLTNDDSGADGFADHPVVSISVAGTVAVEPVPAGGSTFIDGNYGQLEIFSDGTYVYTAFDNDNLNGVFNDAFVYTIVDADGDTSSATLTFNVTCQDDSPVIVSVDPGTVDETDLGADDLDSVSGNVVVDFGDDGPGDVVANGDVPTGLTSCGYPVTVSIDANGNYVGEANGEEIFTLILNTDGSYTFNLTGTLDHPNTADHNDALLLEFGFNAVDADGDVVSGVIPITVLDDGPAINNRWGAFDEADLDNGPIVITRDINHNYGADGEGSIEATGTFQALFEMGGTPQPVTSGGELITVTSTANSYTGTLPDGTVVFTLTIDPSTGQHTYTQYAPIDHVEGANPADEVIWLKFQVQITDKDGDTDTAWIVFDVHDDEPVAVDDEGAAHGGVGATDTGNFLDNDDFGADGEGFLTAISNDNGQTITLADGDTVTINGQYGTLEVSSDGRYTYTLTSNPPGGGAGDYFSYTIVDADGDTSTAYIKFCVTGSDDNPIIITPEVGVVDETDLDPTDEVSGVIDVDFGDDASGATIEGNGTFSFGGSCGQTLTSCGHPVVVTQNADGDYIGTANGATIFTLDIEDDGSYTFTLVGTLDHADTTDHNDEINLFFGVTATDGDGDSASTTLQINVLDDGPSLHTHPTLFSTTVDETDLVNGPLVVSRTAQEFSGYHDFGADGAGEITTNDDFLALFQVGGQNQPLTSGGDLVNVVSTGNGYTGTLADGTVVFTFTIDPATGAHTYTQYEAIDHPDTTNPDDVIWLKFGIQIEDCDGDTDTSYIVIDLKDDGPQAVDDVGLLDTNGVATGTVIMNDDSGADGFDDSPVVSINLDGTVAIEPVPAGGSTFIDGNYGQLEILSDGSYEYTAFNNGGTGTDVFNYTITDADGDSSSAQLTFNVVCGPDDNPIIITPEVGVVDETDLDPTDEVSGVIDVDFGDDASGATIEGNGTFSFGGSCGQTLTSCGHPVVVTQNADGDYIGTANGATIFTLDIEDDGSYTFTLVGTLDHADTTDHNDEINLFFGVTATDGDGDSASTTLQINVLDDGPSLHTHPTLFSTAVDEDTLANGGQIFVSRTAAEFSGYHSFGEDGPGAITTNDDFIAAFQMGGQNQPLTSGGQAITVTSDGSSYTGTLANGAVVFEFTIDPATGAHTYTQNLPIDHPDVTNPDDVIWLKFGIQIEDCDGDTDTSYIVIDLHDSGPQAVDDDGGDLCCDTSVTGNVITNDDSGADGFDDSPVVSINLDGTVAIEPVPAGGSTFIDGNYGQLEILSDGSYEYTAFNNGGTGTDVFNYTITDADGDSSSAQLTFDVACDDNGVPVIEDAKSTVDETYAAPLNGSTPWTVGQQDVLSVDGQVQFDYGPDGPGAITISNIVTVTDLSGNPVPLASNGLPIQLLLTANGYEGVISTPSLTNVNGGNNYVTVFTLDIDTSDGSYTYTQFLPIDHPDESDHDDVIELNFGVQISDVDGDTDDGTITICVKDDGPIAVDDGTVDVSGQPSVIGNILSNDDFGFDGAGALKSVTVDNVTYNIPTTGDIDIVSQYGTLTISANGSYTYVPNGNGNAGIDQFTYEICDADGDTSTAAFNFIVDGCAPPCTIDVDVANISHGLTQHGYDIPLNITITTNGVLDYIIVDIAGEFGGNPNVTLSAGVQTSPGIWEVQAADVPGLQIQLPAVTGVPSQDINNLGGQGVNHNVIVTAYTTDGCVDSDDANIYLIWSPLVLDLDGDGVEHLYYDETDVLFDLDGDGVVDDTGWVGADDGLLALDLNGDGQINNGYELFGTAYEDGFSVLSDYDSNSDGVIDSSDDIWSDLIVWQDVNQDGISQDNEMFTLDDLGITSISLNVTEVDAFENGNYISDASEFTWADGSTGTVEDVWFAYVSGDQDDADAAYEADFDPNMGAPVSTDDLVEAYVTGSYENDYEDLYGDCGVIDGCTYFVPEDDVDAIIDVLPSSDTLEILSVLDNADDALQQSIDEFVVFGGPCLAPNLCDVSDAANATLDTSAATKLEDLVSQDVSAII